MKSNEDLRRAMETTTNAIQIALNRAKQNITSDGPLVLMAHVLETLHNSKRTMEHRISGLPLFGKLMLCVLCRVAQSCDRVRMTAQELRFEATRFTTESQLDEEMILVQADVNVLLATITDMGLIHDVDSKKHNNTKINKWNRYLQLSVPLDEIKQAFRSDSHHKYYQKILGDNY